MKPQLRYPLPLRATTPSGDGTFSSRPYTHSDILSALTTGAWFSPSLSYDFIDRETARFAGEASAFFNILRKESARAVV